MHTGPLLASAVNLVASAVNLDGPGRYLHWSIFTVSEANLVLIAVMVVIFGAALLLRFPEHKAGDPPGPPAGEEAEGTNGTPVAETSSARPALERSDLGDDVDAAMWTSRLRRQALRMLPPGKLLPDRQPEIGRAHV